MPDDGLVTLQSSHDFATTLERLTAALESKGVRVFAQIDHAAGATSAESRLHKFRQRDEWNFCLTARTVVRANQERQ